MHVFTHNCQHLIQTQRKDQWWERKRYSVYFQRFSISLQYTTLLQHYKLLAAFIKKLQLFFRLIFFYSVLFKKAKLNATLTCKCYSHIKNHSTVELRCDRSGWFMRTTNRIRVSIVCGSLEKSTLWPPELSQNLERENVWEPIQHSLFYSGLQSPHVSYVLNQQSSLLWWLLCQCPKTGKRVVSSS